MRKGIEVMRKNRKKKSGNVILLLLALFCVGIGIWLAASENAPIRSNKLDERTAQAAASPQTEETGYTPKENHVVEPKVTDTPAPVSLKWRKKTTKLKVGKTYQFKVSIKNGNVEKIHWSVSNKKIATISAKGVLKGKKKGTVTVRAKYQKASVSCRVKIAETKRKKIIGIDPGHQQTGNAALEPMGPGSSTRKAKVAGGTSGTSTRIPEYQLTMTVAKSLKKELETRGYGVVMTRTKNNVNISNKERAEKINKSGADICVRLHADGGGSSARGASGLYPSSQNPYVGSLSSKSYKLSQSILKKYCAATGIKNRGSVKRDDLTGTNWSKVPVIVLEMGFMTNSAEDQYMASKKGQKAMVQGIADGIDAYYK